MERRLAIALSIYVALLAAASLVFVVLVEPLVVLVVGLPIVILLVALRQAAARRTKLALAVAALISSAITNLALWLGGCSVLGMLDDNDSVPHTGLVLLFLLLSCAAAVSLVLMTVALARSLKRTYARGLVALALWPSAATIACAAIAGTSLALTDSNPQKWFEGFIAIMSLALSIPFAVWVAGAWIVVLGLQAKLTDPPIPPARIHR